MKIGRITASDRASAGIYEDRSGPEIERLLHQHLGEQIQFVSAVVPDDVNRLTETLRDFVDRLACDLIVTTGGTGISSRDVTPEATRNVLDKELPGFGEIMRIRSFAKIETAILSRATAGIRRSTLIVNLPGKPSAVAECLAILTPAILEGVAHLQGRDPHSKTP